jgi:hypothetical protein
LGEIEIQQRIRLACSNGPVRLWRNNMGKLPDPKTGRWVQFGVAHPGGSDLIGYRTLVITPDMVGQHVAQFVALEVKTETGRLSEVQQRFLNHVNVVGGLGAVVRSVDEAQAALQ